MGLKDFANKVANKMLTGGAKLILVAEYHNDPKVERERKRICRGRNSAPCVNYNPDRDQCKKCGCIIEVKSKALTNYNPLKGMRAEITHCPEGFWEDKEVAEYYKNLP